VTAETELDALSCMNDEASVPAHIMRVSERPWWGQAQACARPQMSELDAKYRVSEQASAAMRVRRPASVLRLARDWESLARQSPLVPAACHRLPLHHVHDHRRRGEAGAPVALCYCASECAQVHARSLGQAHLGCTVGLLAGMHRVPAQRDAVPRWCGGRRASAPPAAQVAGHAGLGYRLGVDAEMHQVPGQRAACRAGGGPGGLAHGNRAGQQRAPDLLQGAGQRAGGHPRARARTQVSGRSPAHGLLWSGASVACPRTCAHGHCGLRYASACEVGSSVVAPARSTRARE